MNKKKMIVMSIVPLASVVLLLLYGAGAASFLVGIALIFAIEKTWNHTEKKKGAQP